MPIAVERAPDALLDTSAISNFLIKADHSPVLPFFYPQRRPAISFQSESELLVWAQSPTIPQRHAAQIRGFLRSATVLYADHDSVEHHARIIRSRKDQGRKEKIADAWIAATALARGLPLVTLDRSGFGDIPGLDLILLPATR